MSQAGLLTQNLFRKTQDTDEYLIPGKKFKKITMLKKRILVDFRILIIDND